MPVVCSPAAEASAGRWCCLADEQWCIDRACVMQAVTGSVAQNEEQGQAVQDEARLRLFANIYSNQVAHLTTGMRIGRQPLSTLYTYTFHPRSPDQHWWATTVRRRFVRGRSILLGQAGCWRRISK